MPRKSQSMGDKINGWKTGWEAHKTNAVDFPFLTADVTTFGTNTMRVEKENAKQEKLKADLLAQSLLVKKLVKDNDKLYASLIRYAKAKYGPTSAKIREFLPKTEGTVRPRKQGPKA